MIIDKIMFYKKILNEKHKMQRAFPSSLKEDIVKLCKTIPFDPSFFHSTETFNVIINKEKLYIPSRIYLIDSDIVTKGLDIYTTTQKNLWYCCFTRHHNGFVREKYLKQIIALNEEWVPPYIIQLLGEYVIEILYVIYNNLENLDIAVYKNFIEANIDYYNLTKQRVISYWDCYHRRLYKYKEDYVGFKILGFCDTKILK